jgi:hypothetical protein
MLPGHSYPQLHKYPHLAGNYGGAWYRQRRDFAEFPGGVGRGVCPLCLRLRTPRHGTARHGTTAVSAAHAMEWPLCLRKACMHVLRVVCLSVLAHSLSRPSQHVALAPVLHCCAHAGPILMTTNCVVDPPASYAGGRARLLLLLLLCHRTAPACLLR